MNGHAITVIVVTASAVLNFLLTQPAGTFPANVLLIIGAASIALTTVSRFLPSQGTPVEVKVSAGSEPVPVTAVPANPVNRPLDDDDA